MEELVWNCLKTCFDPEIPVNIVDLGLIYSCEITQTPENKYRVHIKFTLTAPGCPAASLLKSDIESKILALPEVDEVIAELVFDPPWDRNRMSDAAKLKLNLL